VAHLRARLVHEQEQAQVTEEEHHQLQEESVQMRRALGVELLSSYIGLKHCLLHIIREQSMQLTSGLMFEQLTSKREQRTPTMCAAASTSLR
jgi:hypothetical protein